MKLFICSGNTCRSPMAQAIYEKLTGNKAESAGLGANKGDNISRNAVLALNNMGITDFFHMSQPVTLELVEKADEIYCMGKTHKLILASAVPSASEKIFLLDPDGGDVADPYGGCLERYQSCAEEIRGFIEKRFSK